MPTIREKRVYDEPSPTTPVFVAAEQGLVIAKVSGDAVGEFSLARRCTARDVAVGADGATALATETATLVAVDGDVENLQEAGFGPAVAVSVVDAPQRAVVAADEAGQIARLPLPAADSNDPESAVDAADWETLGTVDDVRAVDDRLVAAADGVHRITDSGLDDAGLDDARDVAARGAPLAATGDGLYELGNGWMLAREGGHETVATDGERAHAFAGDGTVLGREEGNWTELDLPTTDSISDFDYSRDGVVAATESGSLLIDAGEGWRSRAIGVTGVQAIAASPVSVSA